MLCLVYVSKFLCIVCWSGIEDVGLEVLEGGRREGGIVRVPFFNVLKGNKSVSYFWKGWKKNPENLCAFFSLYLWSDPNQQHTLMNFLLSSDAENLLMITDSAYKSAPIMPKHVCNVYIFQLSFHFACHLWSLGRFKIGGLSVVVHLQKKKAKICLR